MKTHRKRRVEAILVFASQFYHHIGLMNSNGKERTKDVTKRDFARTQQKTPNATLYVYM